MEFHAVPANLHAQDYSCTKVRQGSSYERSNKRTGFFLSLISFYFKDFFFLFHRCQDKILNFRWQLFLLPVSLCIG